MSEFATADLYDAAPDEVFACELQLRHWGQRTAFSGPIATVRCLEDNVLVRQRLEEPGDGRVLVVDGGGSLRCALVGDILAERGRDSGWFGMVINGAIRDSAVINGMDYSVRALGTNPTRSTKAGKGETDVVLDFGGVRFVPGHWLYADADGIVVSAREQR